MKTTLLLTLAGAAAAAPSTIDILGTPAQCALTKCSSAATGCLGDSSCKAKAGAALSCETAACIKGVAGSDPDAATEALVECVIAQGCVTSASLRGSVRVE